MSVDDGSSNRIRIRAQKPEGEVLPGGVIRTPDGVDHPRPADGWPFAGLEYGGGWPDQMILSHKLVEEYRARGFLTVQGARTVVRPSRPDPDIDEGGSAKVADAHHVPDRTNPLGMPPPHAFPQADQITFRAYAKGGTTFEVYDVTRNPDKYVAGDTTGDQQVTADIYAAGDTEVDWTYTLTRAQSGQES